MGKRYLILEDRTVFKGEAFGADCEVSGEVVFSTGMVGYPEDLTDPSYKEQILVLTYPLIGNYGVPSYQKDKFSFESRSIKINGLVVATYIDEYSHWQAIYSLDKWLKKEGIPAISGIDTRLLTIKLREKGTMLGILQNSDNLQQIKFTDPAKTNLVAKVSIKKPQILGSGKRKILLLDCGVKQGIIDNLLLRGMAIYQVPWDFNLEENQSFDFDAVVISNGPGNPKKISKTIETVKILLKRRVPILGICLGSQILALASGADTYKLKFGHRSCNQPVRLVNTNQCYITTQNHGYAIIPESLSQDWLVWYTNLNDNTIEGIKHKKLPFMAVQFHPEGRPGPEDTNWIFDEFIKTINH